MNFYKLNTSFRSAPRSRHRTLLGSQSPCAHSSLVCPESPTVTGTFSPVQISHLGLGPIKTRTHGHLICKTEGWVWRTCAFWCFFLFFFNILELPSFVMTQSLIFREKLGVSHECRLNQKTFYPLLCLDEAAIRFLSFQSTWVTPQMNTGQTRNAHLYVLWLTLRTIQKNKGETSTFTLNCATE